MASNRQPVRCPGFIARCDVPEYVQQSEELDFKITLWSDPHRAEEVYGWPDFVSTHRPVTEWLGDDFEQWLN